LVVKSHFAPRCVAEAAISILSGVLGLATLLWRDWIELVFRVSPDHGSGALELGIVATSFLVAFASGSLAFRDRRHAFLSTNQGQPWPS
jgi:hypothetical protein